MIADDAESECIFDSSDTVMRYSPRTCKICPSIYLMLTSLVRRPACKNNATSWTGFVEH